MWSLHLLLVTSIRLCISNGSTQAPLSKANLSPSDNLKGELPNALLVSDHGHVFIDNIFFKTTIGNYAFSHLYRQRNIMLTYQKTFEVCDTFYS